MWSLRIEEIDRHKMLNSMEEREIHLENSGKNWRNIPVKPNKLLLKLILLSQENLSSKLRNIFNCSDIHREKVYTFFKTTKGTKTSCLYFMCSTELKG